MTFNIPIYKSQKFQIGHVVHVKTKNSDAVIIYSYYQRYGFGCHDTYAVYLLKNKTYWSWVSGKDLEYVRDAEEQELNKIFRYILRD